VDVAEFTGFVVVAAAGVASSVDAGSCWEQGCTQSSPRLFPKAGRLPVRSWALEPGSPRVDWEPPVLRAEPEGKLRTRPWPRHSRRINWAGFFLFHCSLL